MGRSSGDRANQDRRVWLDRWWQIFSSFIHLEAEKIRLARLSNKRL